MPDELRAFTRRGLELEIARLQALLKTLDTPKKLHWSQTPEGKQRLAAAQKKSWQKRKKAPTATKSQKEPLKER